MHTDIEEIMLDYVMNIGCDENKIYTTETQLCNAEKNVDECSVNKKEQK